jgi:hypothetical protein
MVVQAQASLQLRIDLSPSLLLPGSAIEGVGVVWSEMRQRPHELQTAASSHQQHQQQQQQKAAEASEAKFEARYRLNQTWVSKTNFVRGSRNFCFEVCGVRDSSKRPPKIFRVS